jgi:hypothetical protein
MELYKVSLKKSFIVQCADNKKKAFKNLLFLWLVIHCDFYMSDMSSIKIDPRDLKFI